MKKRKDRRVWGATEVNGIIAIQNPDRHRRTENRVAYQRAWWKRYIAEGPARRRAHTQQACMGCWQLKATDGSDGLGGFTPKNTRRTGWSELCRECRRAKRKVKRDLNQ